MVSILLAGVALLMWPTPASTSNLPDAAGVLTPAHPARGARRLLQHVHRMMFCAPRRDPARGSRTIVGGFAAIGLPSVAAAVASPFLGPAGAVAVAMAAATARRLTRAGLVRRRARLALTDIAAGLRVLARDLRAGVEPRAAVQAASRVSAGAASAVFAELAIGPEVEGFGTGRGEPQFAASGPHDGPSGRPGSDIVRVVAARLRAGWLLSHRAGIAWAAVVEAVARDVADRAAAADARATQVAGPVVSGYVLAALPAAGMLLGAGMGADPLQVLTGSALGGALLVAGTSLTCVGLLWSARIVQC